MTKSTVYGLLVSSMLAGPYAIAQSPTSVAPDNSKTNKLDASNATATADTQSNNSADIDLARRIRQSVVADKSLSTYAHNVKIITNGGRVTLNGVVRSDAEKSAVEMKAADIAGKERVTSDLKVSPGK
jgi:hyperosmotically inducible periplasmic protein